MAEEPPPPPYSDAATGVTDGTPPEADKKDAKGPAAEAKKPDENSGSVFGVHVGEHWVGVNTRPDASGYGIRAFGTLIGVSKAKTEGESDVKK